MQLNVKDIKVKKRIRKEIGSLDELKESLMKHGLLNPITVNSKNELVAGFRRLEAAKALGWEKIEAAIVQTDDKISLLEIELEENNVRKPFTQEEILQGYETLTKLKSPSFFAKIKNKIEDFFKRNFDRREQAKAERKTRNGLLALFSILGLGIIVGASVLATHGFISAVLHSIMDILGAAVLLFGIFFAVKFFIGISKD